MMKKTIDDKSSIEKKFTMKIYYLVINLGIKI